MDAVLEKIQDEAHQAQYSRPRQQPQPGFFVRDAPWQEGQQQQQQPPQVFTNLFTNYLTTNLLDSFFWLYFVKLSFSVAMIDRDSKIVHV